MIGFGLRYFADTREIVNVPCQASDQLVYQTGKALRPC